MYGMLKQRIHLYLPSSSVGDMIAHQSTKARLICSVHIILISTIAKRWLWLSSDSIMDWLFFPPHKKKTQKSKFLFVFFKFCKMDDLGGRIFFLTLLLRNLDCGVSNLHRPTQLICLFFFHKTHNFYINAKSWEVWKIKISKNCLLVSLGRARDEQTIFGICHFRIIFKYVKLHWIFLGVIFSIFHFFFKTNLQDAKKKHNEREEREEEYIYIYIYIPENIYIYI